jgi:hypothetical protein
VVKTLKTAGPRFCFFPITLRKQRSAPFDVGGVMVRKATKRDMVVATLRSPDYTLTGLLRTVRSAGQPGRRLYPKIALTNLMETIDAMDVPVFFVKGSKKGRKEGRKDRQVLPQLANDFLQRMRSA